MSKRLVDSWTSPAPRNSGSSLQPPLFESELVRLWLQQQMDSDKIWPPSLQGFVVTFWPVLLSQQNPKIQWIPNKSRVPVLQVAMHYCQNRQQSPHYYYSLWGACSSLKVRESSKHSFISAFESLRSFRSRLTFPIKNVKLRVKRKAALKNSSFLDLLASALER